MVYLLNPSAIEGWWPMVAPLLEKVWLKTPTGIHETIEDLIQDLAVGLSYCFVDEDKRFAGVFTVNEGRHQKYLMLYTAGGEAPAGGWEEVDSFLEQMAEVFGCSCIQVQGRLGWKRELQPLGYNFDYVTLTKEASHVGRKQGE